MRGISGVDDHLADARETLARRLVWHHVTRRFLENPGAVLEDLLGD